MKVPELYYSLLLIVLINVTSHASTAHAQENNCTVTIQNGTLIGATADTINPFRKVCAYTGIPYASPPVGPLRFKPPQPAQAFGSRNATSPSNWCPQVAYEDPPLIPISEDCLYLNVHQPQNSSNGNLSVMIWFHGGSFISGSVDVITPTKLLARGDVILVAVHYRLGLLGNYGLLDQHTSIRWVRENIGAFGGNPDKITVFGESAGAASAIYQLLSPLNKGLIHGVIAQSGSVLTSWALDPEPAYESAKFMAAKLDCPTDSSSSMVSCLRQLSWKRILEEQTAFSYESFENLEYHFATLTPVVEPNLPGAFITEHPLEIMKRGDFDINVSIILGANKHDGSLTFAALYMAYIGRLGLDKDPVYMREQIVPDILKFFRIEGDEANRGVASSIEMAYLSGVNPSSWNDSMPGLVDVLTVLQYKSSMEATADVLSRRGMNVYLYSFEHHSENSLWSLYFGSLDIPIGHGITHTDDLIYLFDYPAQFSAQDQDFSGTLCDLWINFAISENPTPLLSDRYDQWPVYNTVNEGYMKLNVTPTAMSGYRSSWRPNGFDWN